MTESSGGKPNVARQIGLIAGAIAALSIPVFVGAQSRPSEMLSFEVASIKPDNPAGSSDPRELMQRMVLQYLPGGRFVAKNVTVPILIFEAYNVAPGPNSRIDISPEFRKSLDPKVESQTYDIEAVAEKGAIPGNASPSFQRERIRLMLQTLLADRLKVRIRRETKEVPVYAMVVGKNGPKLQKSTMGDAQCSATSTDNPQFVRLMLDAIDPASCHALVGGLGRGFHGEAIDMSDLVAVIERFSDRPVLDQTGLAGLYKIAIPGWEPTQALPRPTGSEPTTENRTPSDPGRQTLSEVLQDLGLRLESTRAPVEKFVVEHFERPAQN